MEEPSTLIASSKSNKSTYSLILHRRDSTVVQGGRFHYHIMLKKMARKEVGHQATLPSHHYRYLAESEPELTAAGSPPSAATHLQH